MKKIVVSLSERSYPVYIGSGIINLLVNEIKNQNLYRNLFVVIDGNAAHHHLTRIKNVLEKISYNTEYYILPPGEHHKSQRDLNKIYYRLLQKNFGRDTLIVAVGGGVTGDLAGFAASTFLRGVQLVQLPTTILAAVDSSVGGKTGINFFGRKNMIGTFYQPKFVLIDTDFFSTLPRKEKTSGLGEIVKYVFLSDSEFFNFIKDNLNSIYSIEKDIIEKIICISVSIKAEVVKCDEKEAGLRRILNFGHTFAHAFESDLKFKVKHGEAVIAGITAALFLSNTLGFIDRAKLEEFLSFLSKIKLSTKIKDFNGENLVHIMKSDKKVWEGKIKFVLLADIGSLILDAEAKKGQILRALKKTKDFLKRK